MSRIIKKITFSLVFIVLISACSKNSKLHNYNITEQDLINFTKDQKTGDDNLNEGEDIVINQMKYEPIDVVDGILKNPSKKLNIAIVAPMTGKYASIGKAMTESAMLTLNKIKFDQAGNINIYNVTNLKKSNWKENEEIKRLLHDDNDVIIAAGDNIKDTTVKLLSVIPEDKLFISFINDDSLSKQYPNLIALGVDDSYKITSILQYLKDYKRQFLSLLLPATKKGYQMEKLFRKLATNYDIFIVNSQFYQEKTKKSISAAVRGINKNFTATYIVDENGKFTTETYKQNKAKKLQQQDSENTTRDLVQTQTVNIDAIYIDADENDLMTILNSLEQVGILNKNIQLFSNAIFDIEHSIATKLDNVLYIGYNYNIVDVFNKTFKSSFNYMPNYFAYLTYDTISMLLYVSSMWNMAPRYLYNSNGFRGVLDEFRFNRDGNVERRMSIYRLNNQCMSRVFVPDDYISLDIMKGDQDIYFKK